ncbi:hypothetical protein [Candidatus Planktophila dulcis]|uniref:hypothetical protein n=1 Tax=Candidatus Planktophila dulcis TaxID=1884914 RepID=UPI003BEF275E
MSTKTTFKRLALVAVASLGLSLVSVAPSQAVAGVLTLTPATGQASVTGGATNETATAATISMTGLATASTDTYSVTVIRKSAPATGGSVAFRLALAETNTAVASEVLASAALASASVKSLGYATNTAAGVTVNAYDSLTAFTTGSAAGVGYQLSGGAGYVGAKFGLLVDSGTTRVAGTYVFTIVVQPYENNVLKANSQQTADLTFTITDTAANVAAANGTIDPSKTTAVLNAGSSITTTTDSSVAVVATASATNHATIQVKTFTSTSLAAPESVTVTLTGAGVVCDSAGTICGNNITIAGDGDDLFRVRANGTAGTASIVVKTTTKTFPSKLVSFYAKSPATITVSTNKPVLAVAAASAQTDSVRAVATDANGIVWGGQIYVIASTAADALIAGSATPAACTFNAAKGYHECPVVGTAKGTANLKAMDASLDTDATIATTDAAVTSAATAVRVSTGSASTVKFGFDKSTYSPGEKAILTVSVLDEDGLALPSGAISNVFASAPTTNVAFTSGTGPTTSVTLAAATSSTGPTTAGAETYVMYMPNAVGDLTITGTGSTGLAAAGRVAVSATASVVNSSVDAATDAANEATDAANAATDAALAAADAADAATAAAQDASDAVAALSATVAKLVASLKAQITSLTNLVIKIQKKVKA